MQERDDKNLSSIDKAILVLETLCIEGSEGISLKELSEKLGLHKSTVHRILDTFKNHSLARQEEDNNEYRPGLRIMELGEQALEGVDIRKEAHDELRELSNQLNEVVHLGIIEDGQVVYLDKFNPPQRAFQIYSSIGKRAPVHCTGLGKAILASLPDKEAENIIRKNGLQKFTPQTITSKSEFREELGQIREQGYAFDNKEHEEEVRCIAVPIHNHNREVKAAISVTAPSFRVELGDLEDYASEVKETARLISKKMGHNQYSS